MSLLTLSLSRLPGGPYPPPPAVWITTVSPLSRLIVHFIGRFFFALPLESSNVIFVLPPPFPPNNPHGSCLPRSAITVKIVGEAESDRDWNALTSPAPPLNLPAPALFSLNS